MRELRPRNDESKVTGFYNASKPKSLKRKADAGQMDDVKLQATVNTITGQEDTTARHILSETIAVEPALTPRKKAKYQHSLGSTPFPEHPHPTPEECKEVEQLLISVHGPSVRPQTMEINNSVSGCGEVPSVLDALMRTILSANTSNGNSARAFQGLIGRFGLEEEGSIKQEVLDESTKASKTGTGTVHWDAIRRAPRKELFEAIKSGGLADMKSKNMKAILDQVWQEGKERKKAARLSSQNDENLENDEQEDGELSLDYLHELDDEAAKAKLVSYKGVGVKTAACVLLFCLKRESFAVDTHIFRMAKFLNWVPQTATRDTTCFHLDSRIPSDMKYSLHNLLIRHGRMCKHCKGGPEPNTQRPSPKSVKASTLKNEDPDVKVKRTKKIWVGNGLMKEVVVEIDTDQEGGELEQDACILEPLVNRVRKARRTRE
ncbi:DNA glycosylase [Geopyxis carbonaria]|nr:DNA glycosylase [Geopyxis carbonaria]